MGSSLTTVSTEILVPTRELAENIVDITSFPDSPMFVGIVSFARMSGRCEEHIPWYKTPVKKAPLKTIKLKLDIRHHVQSAVVYESGKGLVQRPSRWQRSLGGNDLWAH